MKNETPYKLRDFYSSCLLRTLGFKLLRIDYISDNFATFVFQDPDKKASSVLTAYWDKKIQVDARSLIETINELKTRLHNKT